MACNIAKSKRVVIVMIDKGCTLNDGFVIQPKTLPFSPTGCNADFRREVEGTAEPAVAWQSLTSGDIVGVAMISGVITVSDCPHIVGTGYAGGAQLQSIANNIQGDAKRLHTERDVVQEDFITVGSIAQSAAGHGVGGIEGVPG